MRLWLNFQAYLYSSAEVSGKYRHQSQNWFIFESQTFVPCWLGSICCLGLLCFSSFPCSWQQLHIPNNKEVDKMQGNSKIQYFQMHQQIPTTYPIHDLKRKNGWLNLDLSKTSAVSVLTVWWPKGDVRKCNDLKSVVQENNPISELKKTDNFFFPCFKGTAWVGSSVLTWTTWLLWWCDLCHCWHNNMKFNYLQLKSGLSSAVQWWFLLPLVFYHSLSLHKAGVADIDTSWQLLESQCASQDSLWV